MITGTKGNRIRAARTRIVYRRGREEMPAHTAELDDAETEGVSMDFLLAPVEALAAVSGTVTGVRCRKMRLGPPDATSTGPASV